MASYQVKQSSTSYPLVFLMVDSSDHVTGKTGLSPTVTLSKAGGSFASPSGAVTEIASGWYKVAGNATDTGTLGPLALHATGTGADPVDVLYEVVAHDVQDAVRLGLSSLPNAAAAASGGLLTYGTGTGQLNPASGKIPATLAAADVSGNPSMTVAAYAGGQDPATLVLDTAASGHNTAGTIGNKINSAGSASDPLANAGSTYTTPGTIGYIINNRVDTTISSRQASGNVTVGGYAASQDPATYVLSTAAYKLTTDSNGRVQVQGGTGAGQIALSSGLVSINQTDAVATSNTAGTVGDALNAARAQGFGKWVLSGTTLTLYAADGTTAVRTFTLDSASAPTQRV